MAAGPERSAPLTQGIGLQTPEQLARQTIDALLAAAGWARPVPPRRRAQAGDAGP